MISKDKIALLRSLVGEVRLPLSMEESMYGERYIVFDDKDIIIAEGMTQDDSSLIKEALNALPELLEVYEMYEDLCK